MAIAYRYLVFAVLAFGGCNAKSFFSSLFRRQTCDSETEIERCVAGLTMLGDPLAGGQLAKLDAEEELNAVCSIMDDAKSCMTSYLERCFGGHSDLATETVLGVLDYMCGPEGRAALLGDAECWENDRLETQLEECTVRMQNDMMNIMVRGGTQRDICPALDGLRRCAHLKVEQDCSPRAGQFIDQLLYHALRPVSNDVGCSMQLRVARDLHTLLKLARRR